MVTATRHETEAERLDEDETIEPEEVDDNLDGKQLEKAGRFVALWNHTDAQFFVVRMDQFDQTVYDGDLQDGQRSRRRGRDKSG